MSDMRCTTDQPSDAEFTDWELARRQFLKTSGMGLGAAVLGCLLPQNRQARASDPVGAGAWRETRDLPVHGGCAQSD